MAYAPVIWFASVFFVYVSSLSSPTHDESALDGHMMNISDHNSKPLGARVLHSKTVHKAVAVLTGPSAVRGTVIFQRSLAGGVTITGNITGLPPNSRHGFDVHEYGDLSDGCVSPGGHFDPFGSHTEMKMENMPATGDLGTIVANSDGVIILNLTNKVLALDGPTNVLAHAVIIHETEDHGEMGSAAGARGRIACGVIGLAGS